MSICSVWCIYFCTSNINILYTKCVLYTLIKCIGYASPRLQGYVETNDVIVMSDAFLGVGVSSDILLLVARPTTA